MPQQSGKSGFEKLLASIEGEATRGSCSKLASSVTRRIAPFLRRFATTVELAAALLITRRQMQVTTFQAAWQ